MSSKVKPLKRKLKYCRSLSKRRIKTSKHNPNKNVGHYAKTKNKSSILKIVKRYYYF